MIPNKMSKKDFCSIIIMIIETRRTNLFPIQSHVTMYQMHMSNKYLFEIRWRDKAASPDEINFSSLQVQTLTSGINLQTSIASIYTRTSVSDVRSVATCINLSAVSDKVQWYLHTFILNNIIYLTSCNTFNNTVIHFEVFYNNDLLITFQ